ncbi:MAG: hypothetical protein PVG38_15380 [Gammaproteobacteria bacterium]|jgi:hypothetical protein
MRIQFTALLCLVVGHAIAAPIVDQEQVEVAPLSEIGAIVVGGPDLQRVAQVITAGVTGDLVQVDLAVACPSGDDLVLQVYEVVVDDRGMFTPGLGLLATEVIPGMQLPPFPDPLNPDFRSLSLSRPVAFTAGEMFAVVVVSPGTCAMPYGPVGDPYLGGDGWTHSNSQPIWVPVGGATGRADLGFRTWMDVPDAVRPARATKLYTPPILVRDGSLSCAATNVSTRERDVVITIYQSVTAGGADNTGTPAPYRVEPDQTVAATTTRTDPGTYRCELSGPRVNRNDWRFSICIDSATAGSSCLSGE